MAALALVDHLEAEMKDPSNWHACRGESLSLNGVTECARAVKARQKRVGLTTCSMISNPAKSKSNLAAPNGPFPFLSIVVGVIVGSEVRGKELFRRPLRHSIRPSAAPGDI